MSISVNVQASDPLRAMRKRTLETYQPTVRAVRATCRIIGVDAAEISVTWLPDPDIAWLNMEYLEHDGPTDVISFPLYDADAGERPVGDVYIGYDQAVRQAATFRTTLHDELVRLAVHGTLHVLGFDHPEGDSRLDSEMWSLQEAIVAEVLA